MRDGKECRRWRAAAPALPSAHDHSTTPRRHSQAPRADPARAAHALAAKRAHPFQNKIAGHPGGRGLVGGNNSRTGSSGEKKKAAKPQANVRPFLLAACLASKQARQDTISPTAASKFVITTS